MTMPTSKPLFNEFTARKKYRVPTFLKFCEKNVLWEKGDEITRFDSTFLISENLRVFFPMFRISVRNYYKS